MAAPMEVAVCTDSAAQLWSCVVWELHSGANLLTYRGGQAGPRGLALLNGEYLLAAQLGKNYINAWELQRKDQLQQKIMCPGPVTCLTTSPNGLYVLAGIAESIYLWEPLDLRPPSFSVISSQVTVPAKTLYSTKVRGSGVRTWTCVFGGHSSTHKSISVTPPNTTVPPTKQATGKTAASR
uniref:WD repeat-containing protein 18 n=1 Tax=Equus asinus TaxID=9793 RepID=A0A9L0JMX4_EQUAS